MRYLAAAVIVLVCQLGGLVAAETGPPIVKLKQLLRETSLVVGGRPAAVIVVPKSAAGGEAGALVAGRIREATGADLEVTTDPARADLAKTHVIALGNLLDNPVIERLYWNRYSLADKQYPGPGKFTLRSVSNPYPWAAGKNAFLVEASDEAGLRAGAVRLAEKIRPGRDLVLPWTLETGDYRPSAEAPAAAGSVDPSRIGFVHFTRTAQAYLRRPNPTLLREARLILDGLCEVYRQDPQHHLTWPDETNSEWIMPSWDAIEEADGLSDAERLRYTNLLLAELRAHPQHIYEYATLEQSPGVPPPLRHQYDHQVHRRARYPAHRPRLPRAEHDRAQRPERGPERTRGAAYPHARLARRGR